MNGILAQTAALTAHAKVHALDPQLGGDDAYWAAHSTFKYVKTVTFLAVKRGLLRSSQQEIATTPPGWMTALPRASVIRFFSLGAAGSPAAHVASAFVGGTREGIGVSSSGSNDIWIPAWNATGDKYPEQKIWRVQYTMVKDSGIPLPAPTVVIARERLGKALREITDFAAADSGLSPWCETFQRAADALGAPNPAAPYHPDILPPEGYTLEARQLLAAAVGGFVFGGMGSWNDGGPESSDARQEYEQLSTELYAAVMEGLGVAVNDGAAG
jgi:hypothetical protein